MWREARIYVFFGTVERSGELKININTDRVISSDGNVLAGGVLKLVDKDENFEHFNCDDISIRRDFKIIFKYEENFVLISQFLILLAKPIVDYQSNFFLQQFSTNSSALDKPRKKEAER